MPTHQTPQSPKQKHTFFGGSELRASLRGITRFKNLWHSVRRNFIWFGWCQKMCLLTHTMLLSMQISSTISFKGLRALCKVLAWVGHREDIFWYALICDTGGGVQLKIATNSAQEFACMMFRHVARWLWMERLELQLQLGKESGNGHEAFGFLTFHYLFRLHSDQQRH